MIKPVLLLLLVLPMAAVGFTAMPSIRSVRTATPTLQEGLHHHNRHPFSTRLFESMVEVKVPPEAEWVRVRGAREWPQQLKTGSWSETVDSGKLVTRYVLDGTGSLGVTLYSDDGQPKINEPAYHQLVKGSLVEAMGPATLEWQVEDQMLILTPGYEQGSLFAAVAAIFVVLCGALISGVGQ